METKITLDEFDHILTNYKLDDLQKKVDITANIIKQCNMNKVIKSSCRFTKSSVLTGVPLETMIIINNLEQKSKKFSDWFLEQKSKRHVTDFSYKCLRRELIHSYIEWKEIAANLKEKRRYNMYCYKKYFTPVQISGTKSSVVMERPEFVMERQRFLYKKMMFRDMNKNIVYLGKVNLLVNKGRFSFNEDNVDIKSRFLIAVSPTYGHMGYLYCSGHTQEYLRSWLQERIMPDLPPESVIIFQENLLSPIDPIDSFSTKEDMIKWLTLYEIPHEKTMHKADLYKLIKEFERTMNEHVQPEQFLRANGHIPLRKNNCNIGYNFFDPFWEFLIHELNNAIKPLESLATQNTNQIITRIANVVVQNAPLDYWAGLENLLQEREEEIYREDREMEHVIDKVMTMAKYEGLPPEGAAEYAKLDENSEIMEKDHIVWPKKLGIII